MGYASEKLKQARYSYSEQEVKRYFTGPGVLAGLFGVIESLYGVRVREDSAPTWHADVRFYRVEDPSGRLLGQFYLDPYAREGKRGGAWMDDCRNRRVGATGTQTPLVYLVCNFGKGVDGRPATFSHDEVTTLFHEMGHGLHQLLTAIGELPVAGINGVEWDAVELPSQFMENFCWEWDRVQAMTAHVDNGQPLPRELFDRMLAAKNFQSGMFTVRQLEFALFDMELHSRFDPTQDRVLQLLERVRDEVAVNRAPALAPLPAPVQPHLRRWLCGRLLQLQVGRGAQRRRLCRVRGNAGPAGADRRAVPGRGAVARRQPQRAGELHRVPWSRAEHRRAAAPLGHGGLGSRPAAGKEKPGGCRALHVCIVGPAQGRANTSVALVPPKPKLLDITRSSCASRLSRTIGKPSARSSSFSMLAEPAMKPSRIISRL